MTKNYQILIISTMGLGVFLILGLASILTRGNESGTETAIRDTTNQAGVNDNQRLEDASSDTDDRDLLIGKANSQTALVNYDREGRIIGKITDRNTNSIHLHTADFELVDDMYVHATIVIRNPTAQPADIACLYGAYTSQSGASGIFNYTVNPGDNKFSGPLSPAIYSKGPDVFDDHNFQIECSIGHDPMGIEPKN